MRNRSIRRVPTRRALLSLALLLFACDPAPHPRAHAIDAGRVKLSWFALGDTGQRHREPASILEGQMAVANAIASEDRRDPADALVLLGDNFYRNGLHKDELVERIGSNLVRPYCRFSTLAGPRSQEVADECSTPAGERRSIPIYAVLGNHDWLTPESPDLQRHAVPDFVPEWQMTERYARAVELGEGVSLVLIESEPAFGAEQAAALTQALRQSQGPWRVVAAHRPIEVDDWGRLPAQGPYTLAVEAAISAANVQVQLFLSGHLHSLQIVEGRHSGPGLHVIAGSGSRSHPIGEAHPNRRFESTSLGFARIDLLEAHADSGERLAVTLFGTADIPLIAADPPAILARWSVDLAGRTRDELAYSR